MQVYKVGRSKYAKDLTGEGARLYGGRWNHRLIPCIYTSESRALALLEYTVNIDIEEIPRALTITTFEIPDNSISVITEKMLPGNWKDIPAPSSTKDFGTSLLQKASKAVIKIPSCIVRHEFNYLLNPLHPLSKQIKIVDIADLFYDLRIKK